MLVGRAFHVQGRTWLFVAVSFRERKQRWAMKKYSWILGYIWDENTTQLCEDKIKPLWGSLLNSQHFPWKKLKPGALGNFMAQMRATKTTPSFLKKKASIWPLFLLRFRSPPWRWRHGDRGGPSQRGRDMGTREVSLSELALCIGDFGRRWVQRQVVDSPAGVVFGITNEKLPTEKRGELVYSWFKIPWKNWGTCL